MVRMQPGWTGNVDGNGVCVCVCQDLSSTRGMSSNPHKLDLMAENSSLKVKLAKTEKSLRDSEERLGFAQVCCLPLSHVSISLSK